MDENGLSPSKWIWSDNVTWTQNETEVSKRDMFNHIITILFVKQLYYDVILVGLLFIY